MAPPSGTRGLIVFVGWFLRQIYFWHDSFNLSEHQETRHPFLAQIFDQGFPGDKLSMATV
jgi:hypothetical protein